MQDLTLKIKDTVKKLYDLEQAVELTVPDESFGDYSTNIAMKLAKELGKNPREIAEAIKDELLADDSIKNIQIAGPGFINFYLKDSYPKSLKIKFLLSSILAQMHLKSYMLATYIKLLPETLSQGY